MTPEGIPNAEGRPEAGILTGMSPRKPPAEPDRRDEYVAEWVLIALLDIAAVIYLVVSRALGIGIGELDVVAFCLLGTTLFFALFGIPRVEADPAGIRFFRRGRLRWSRPLSDFARLSPGLFGMQRIVFRDGAWVWFAALGPEGTRIADFLATLPVSQPRRRGVSTRADVLDLPLAALRFPGGQCIGCRRPAETVLELEARRGFTLLLVGFFLVRDLEAPGCRACKTRRTVLGLAAYAVPILTFVYFLFGRGLAPMEELEPRLRLVCLCISVAGTLFLMNWGARFLDYAAFGVAPLSLSADSTHVRLRVRDVALRQALEEGARGEPRATESARFELG
ncbi:hypothetical protein [Pyxidicoccus caerfyrddinensis]|uniref:hypothetical protein n=1 Tax=Pyxidicoccus caerfyrddinensis TaxID=2709663 RepID=UPI0013DA2B4A|nr:hypothetical protein [Pyxidicoccus caerfyrddinensis]